MVVMKFGGTSVGSAQAIRRVAGIIQSRLEQDPVVVSSAVGGITNKLVELYHAGVEKDRDKAATLLDFIITRHRHILSELELRNDTELRSRLRGINEDLNEVLEEIFQTSGRNLQLYDRLLCVGELSSTNILAAFLRKQGTASEMVDSRELMITDSNFSAARPLFSESKDNVDEILKPMIGQTVPVLQGFIGSDNRGRTTTLGRGGSDFSATLFGAMLGVDTVEIWSDVDGVLSADPSIVPEAGRIEYMTFEEAAELAYFGAKVLHPATLQPAREHNISVVVLNSMNSECKGTAIVNQKPASLDEAGQVKSIAYKEGLTVITVESGRMLMAHGFMSLLFSIFDKYETSVDLVTTSEVSVSLTVDNPVNVQKIVYELEKFADVRVEQEKAIVCLVGEGLKMTPGIPGKIFSMLQDIKIYLIAQGASEINLSFVINEHDLPRVITRLHDQFFKKS